MDNAISPAVLAGQRAQARQSALPDETDAHIVDAVHGDDPAAETAVKDGLKKAAQNGAQRGLRLSKSDMSVSQNRYFFVISATVGVCYAWWSGRVSVRRTLAVNSINRAAIVI